MLLAAAQVSSTSAADTLKRLTARLPVALVHVPRPADLSGRYTGQTRELRARVGPFLSGEDLYLFPDGTYIYCEWSDIMPKTVHDKGNWIAKDGIVEFVSDEDMTWDPELDRRHVVLRRASHEKEIMIIAVPSGIEYFDKNAGDDAELMLLIVGMARTEMLPEKTSSTVKTRLMREAWDPKFFRKR
jgi:hypothetical protein